MRRHVPDPDRVPEVRLVRAEFQHRRLIRDAREGIGRHRARGAAEVAKFLEHARQHRLDRREDVFLRHEAHLEVELVELTGAAVGAGRLVPEAGGDLEIAVEARDHRQLLELLRRLRQRVEFSRMQPRGHQEVPRPFRARRRQDRGLKFAKTLFDHPPPDGGDDGAAEHQIPLLLLPPQVEEAVAQAQILGEVLFARHLDRQHFRGGLHRDLAHAQLDLPGRELRVHRPGFPRHDFPGHRHHAFGADRIEGLEARRALRHDALGQAVMIAQIDEQQPAMVALAVHPAGKPDGLARIGGTKGAAGMGAVGVHEMSRSAWKEGENAPAPPQSQAIWRAGRLPAPDREV